MTLREMLDQILDDLDLRDEDWVSEADLTRWLNEAVRVAESEIHTLYEDYFLTPLEDQAISSGQNYVDYPSDIYANKIRKIIFHDGLGNTTTSHEVMREKDLLSGIDKDLYMRDTSLPILTWAPTNDATNGRRIRLFPKQGRAGYLDIWYIRNAKQLSADSDVTDIDEFSRFLVQYAKTKVYLKDGDPRADDSKVLEEQYKREMILSLSDMTPDDNNELEMDLDHYEDSV